MISEHAITYKNHLSLDDLNYLIKKSNRLGKSDREVMRVYEESDIDGTHIYFEVVGLKERR